MLGFGTNKTALKQAPVPAAARRQQQPAAPAEAAAQQTDPRMQAFIDQRIDEVEAQVRAFRQKKPDFDLEQEMQNTAFADYLWNKGLSVEDAYLLAHKEEIFQQVRAEALQALRERQGRITENGAGKNSPVLAKKNPRDLTDAEIEDILARVQNGERISF